MEGGILARRLEGFSGTGRWEQGGLSDDHWIGEFRATVETTQYFCMGYLVATECDSREARRDQPRHFLCNSRRSRTDVGLTPGDQEFASIFETVFSKNQEPRETNTCRMLYLVYVRSRRDLDHNLQSKTP